MRLPMQSQPVQRTIPSQPFALRDTSGATDAERGVTPSGYGVHPNDWTDLLKVNTVFRPIMPFPF